MLEVLISLNLPIKITVNTVMQQFTWSETFEGHNFSFPSSCRCHDNIYILFAQSSTIFLNIYS